MEVYSWYIFEAPIAVQSQAVFSVTNWLHVNAAAEAFFAMFKKQEGCYWEYALERHFRKSANEYVSFYNEVWPNQTLRYKTPQAFEAVGGLYRRVVFK